jgi:hypothetical protein
MNLLKVYVLRVELGFESIVLMRNQRDLRMILRLITSEKRLHNYTERKMF